MKKSIPLSILTMKNLLCEFASIIINAEFLLFEVLSGILPRLMVWKLKFCNEFEKNLLKEFLFA